MALKHFITDKYNSLGEALLDIRKELQRLQPIDSGSIAWEQTDTGMSAHVGDGGMGGSMPTETSDEGAAGISAVSAGYNGYFKLVDMTTTENGVTTYKIGVVDGETYDSSMQTSGDSLITVNGSRVFLPSQVFTLETGTGSKTFFVAVEYVWNTGEVRIVANTTLPPEDDSIQYLHIGRCVIKNGYIDIEQIATQGVYSLNTEYTGFFKLYRYETENGYAVAVKDGYADAVGTIPGKDIDWTGGVYVNFTVSDDTEKIVAAIEDTYLNTDSGVSVHVGYVASNGTVTQSLKSTIRLAGSYVI